ncbi:MAG: DUF6364 family protein [Thiothrix sp.]|jgi:hypothetical protein|uniref:DUF6364 family protein n=1 Tax=Thiothrix sp. TaxID=1032 RepID=UPI002627262C|nr:DUF6364 family protein [Thiothrix sp.]MDD5393630.1 DUF6364 family protein [Thiothrix sp.]
MQTKLTLRLEDNLIEQAKTYAKQHGKSLSQMVADYFSLLTIEPDNFMPAPITHSLTGLLADSGLDESHYKQHLSEKYR